MPCVRRRGMTASRGGQRRNAEAEALSIRKYMCMSICKPWHRIFPVIQLLRNLWETYIRHITKSASYAQWWIFEEMAVSSGKSILGSGFSVIKRKNSESSGGTSMLFANHDTPSYTVCAARQPWRPAKHVSPPWKCGQRSSKSSAKALMHLNNS